MLIIYLFVLLKVVPAVLGLTAAAILAVTACFCARSLRLRNKKTAHDSGLPFQPPRRPTAVRSPSGAPPHYLKKSPSPTAPKPPPGAPQSPQEHQTRYAEESEVVAKHIVSDGKGTILGPNNDTINIADTPDSSVCVGGIIISGTEYGKLGTLVFKLRYLTDRSALVVSVVRCRGLPGKQTASAIAAATAAAAALTNGNGNGNGHTNGSSCAIELPANANGKTQNATDPYVKLQLLPDKQHKVKTR